MCTSLEFICPGCRTASRENRIVKCDLPDPNEEASCCLGGYRAVRCGGVRHETKAFLCNRCSGRQGIVKQQTVRARAQARHAAKQYHWPGTRDSVVDAGIHQELARMPGAEFYYPPGQRRVQQRAEHLYYHQQGAVPVRRLPNLNMDVQEVRSHRPMVHTAPYQIPEAMSATVQHVPSNRDPQMAQVYGQSAAKSSIRRPTPAFPPRKKIPTRRDTNEVSPLSDTGDENCRNYAVSPLSDLGTWDHSSRRPNTQSRTHR